MDSLVLKGQPLTDDHLIGRVGISRCVRMGDAEYISTKKAGGFAAGV